MSVELANNLLNTFGLTIGIDGLCLDEQGYCCLRFDALDTHFQYNQANDNLVLFAQLGKLDEDALADGCTWMMNANLFWAGTNGGTLAVQPGVNLVFLQTRTPIQGMDYPCFERWVGEFVSATDQWVLNIQKLNAGETLAAAETAEATVPGANALFV
ncbi:MAG: hypothetical protein QG599_57 [Pseudomonadota bacterium]|nr:hypothetical protein [Pseudomonadota bacterium]